MIAWRSDLDFRAAPSLQRALAGEPVRVGSENRAKLEAVGMALRALAASEAEGLAISVVAVDVASGVPEQPIGLEQIVEGARGRARAALASGPCALAVGIEDGLASLGGLGADNIGCAWVTDGEREAHGFSAAFAYPSRCLEPALREQAPIGILFDDLWQQARHRRSPGDAQAGAESGRREGNIGRLSGGRLSRSAYGSQAVLCALVPFLHVDLYD
jgi:inosine/xanthosine triphosphatase